MNILFPKKVYYVSVCASVHVCMYIYSSCAAHFMVSGVSLWLVKYNAYSKNKL